MEIRKKWQRSLVFHSFLVLCLAYTFSYSKLGLHEWYLDRSIAQVHSEFKNKRILNLSEDFSWYYGRSPATVFYNWQLSKEYFTNLDDYENIRIINESMLKDLPEVIIDPNRHVEKLFHRMPKLKPLYEKKEENYVLIGK